MRLPDGWTVGREQTENGVRKLALVKMPPVKERMERAAREADAALADLAAEGIPIERPASPEVRERVRAIARKHGWGTRDA